MKNYTPDSLERALALHVKEGRLRSYRRDDSNPRQRWTVEGNGGVHPNDATFSDREAAALCFGLASAHYQPQDKDNT